MKILGVGFPLHLIGDRNFCFASVYVWLDGLRAYCYCLVSSFPPNVGPMRLEIHGITPGFNRLLGIQTQVPTVVQQARYLLDHHPSTYPMRFFRAKYFCFVLFFWLGRYQGPGVCDLSSYDSHLIEFIPQSKEKGSCTDLFLCPELFSAPKQSF